MNASSAKKAALENKKLAAEKIKVNKSELRDADVKILLDDFHRKIDAAVQRGEMSTDKLSYSSTRFDSSIISEVVDQIRSEGFNVVMDKHNAFQTIKFTISWAE